ncbi:MAG: ABC transporter substrate-binding protein [Verrucomicrobiales bacterium]|nr:ABC transporter substrate-binding protein [Verrucomicrobiales bacterium]
MEQRRPCVAPIFKTTILMRTLKITTRTFLITTAFCMMSACLIGCKPKESTPPAAQRELILGMLAPMTGPGARFGESQRNGVQLAIDEINGAGGINGSKFQLVVEDTKTEPPMAVTAFTRLAERKDLVCIFGSAASLDVPAYLPRVDGATIPHVLPVAVLPKITEMGSTWTFRTALNDKIAAVKMAAFVIEQLKAKKIALLIEDSAFGETALNFASEAERLGVKPLTIERLKRGDLDTKPQLTKIRNLGATHIQFWGYYTEYALVAKQLKELGYSAVLLGNQAPVNDKTIELGGPAVEGAMNICLFVPTSSNPRIKEFVSRYHAKFNADPDTWAAQSYDSMYLVADAIKRGGATRQGLRDALAKTQNFSGLTGTISFNSNGDAEYRGISVVKVAGGKFVSLEDSTK